jgi:hypothetical protein
MRDASEMQGECTLPLVKVRDDIGGEHGAAEDHPKCHQYRTSRSSARKKSQYSNKFGNPYANHPKSGISWWGQVIQSSQLAHELSTQRQFIDDNGK